MAKTGREQAENSRRLIQQQGTSDGRWLSAVTMSSVAVETGTMLEKLA